MMSLIKAIKSARREIVIIGTIPFIVSDHWDDFKSAFFERTDFPSLAHKIYAESDNQLFNLSLSTDTPSSPKRLSFIKMQFLRNIFREKFIERADSSSFRLSQIHFPVNIVSIDGAIWYLPTFSSGQHCLLFKEITKSDTWYPFVMEILNSIQDPTKDGKYTAASNDELLELFDNNRKPRGIFPRNCFYDSDHFQLVVWGLVFSREGQLLIHKRSCNAKDNRNLWDKSIGGHVDFSLEHSSTDAAIRELVEELFTSEHHASEGREFSLFTVDTSKILNLGDWNTTHANAMLNVIEKIEYNYPYGEEPWVLFRLPESLVHYSPRLLPNGLSRKLHVFADIFVFIANSKFDQNYADRVLMNSTYRLADSSELKTWAENKIDYLGHEFLVSPDLQHILNGKLRDSIDEISTYIQQSNIRKSSH